ncbi:MAG: CHAP domain-containing protein [Clostridiales bacterium]|nr:CHAP domain-containing protein [Clostridiales bacterium]
MKKSLISTIAVSLIAASFFSVTTVKSANADDIIGSCGQYIDYSNRKAAAMFAESLVGQPYSQMPKTIKDVNANWCAAFVRYVYGSGNEKYNSVTLIKNASGCFIQNLNYEPEIGDLVIYEEDGNPGNGYEHIGIVVKGGKDYETVEGNAFYIEKNNELQDINKITVDQYGIQAQAHNLKDRHVLRFTPDQIRKSMVAGFVRPDNALKDKPTPSKYLCGDVNRDGKVTPADATMIMRALLQMSKDGGMLKKSDLVNYDEIDFYYRMDANGDGKVEQIDATAILQKSLSFK